MVAVLCNLIRFVRLHSLSAWHIHAIVLSSPSLSSFVFLIAFFFSFCCRILNVRNFNINCKISHSLLVVWWWFVRRYVYTLDKTQCGIVSTWNCVLRHKFLSHFHFYTCSTRTNRASRIYFVFVSVSKLSFYLTSSFVLSLPLSRSQAFCLCVRAGLFIQIKCYSVSPSLYYVFKPSNRIDKNSKCIHQIVSLFYFMRLILLCSHVRPYFMDAIEKC